MRALLKIILFIPLSILLCAFIFVLYDYLIEALYLEAGICFVFILLILILLRGIIKWDHPSKNNNEDDMYFDEDEFHDNDYNSFN